MRPTSRWSHLRRLFLRSAPIALGAMLCAPVVFAGSSIMTRESTNADVRAASQKPTQKNVQYFVLSSASAIPRPISWVVGGVITTAVPIEIIGRGETIVR